MFMWLLSSGPVTCNALGIIYFSAASHFIMLRVQKLDSTNVLTASIQWDVKNRHIIFYLLGKVTDCT